MTTHDGLRDLTPRSHGGLLNEIRSQTHPDPHQPLVFPIPLHDLYYFMTYSDTGHDPLPCHITPNNRRYICHQHFAMDPQSEPFVTVTMPGLG